MNKIQMQESSHVGEHENSVPNPVFHENEIPHEFGCDKDWTTKKEMAWIRRAAFWQSMAKRLGYDPEKHHPSLQNGDRPNFEYDENNDDYTP